MSPPDRTVVPRDATRRAKIPPSPRIHPSAGNNHPAVERISCLAELGTCPIHAESLRYQQRGLGMRMGQKTPEQVRRDWWREQRAYAKREIRDSLPQKFGGDLFVKGFVIHVGNACRHAAHLNDTFVPLDMAFRNPSLLPPYQGCDFETCDCYFEQVLEGDRMSRHLRRQIGKMERRVLRRPGRHRLLRGILWLAVLLAVCWWWLHR